MLELAIARRARLRRRRPRGPPRRAHLHAWTRSPSTARECGPDTPLVFLCGTDAFARVETWHRWESLFELAHFAVAVRADDPEWHLEGARRDPEGPVAARDDEPEGHPRARPPGAIMTFAMTPLAISSTAIRALVQAAASIRYLTPDPVVDYIHQHQLYGTIRVTKTADHARQEETRRRRPRGHQGPRHPRHRREEDHLHVRLDRRRERRLRPPDQGARAPRARQAQGGRLRDHRHRGRGGRRVGARRLRRHRGARHAARRAQLLQPRGALGRGQVRPARQSHLARGRAPRPRLRGGRAVPSPRHAQAPRPVRGRARASPGRRAPPPDPQDRQPEGRRGHAPSPSRGAASPPPECASRSSPSATRCRPGSSPASAST